MTVSIFLLSVISIIKKFHEDDYRKLTYKQFLGDTVQGCISQDVEFICPTANNNSFNQTCDTNRCPIQGSPTAPKMETQSAGMVFTAFGTGRVPSTFFYTNETQQSK